MCTRTDHDGACEDCAMTDTWVDLQPDPDTVTLRRGDVAHLLQAVEASRLVSHISRSVTNRVRAALGWGDGA